MTRWLEQSLGATIPLEVVIGFPPGHRTTALERMRLVAEAHAELGRLPGASGCLSAATFAPPTLIDPGGAGRLVDVALNALLETRKPLLRDHGWISRSDGAEYWRLSLRVRGIDDLDYTALTGSIRDRLEPLLDTRPDGSPSEADLIITGTAPIVFKARHSLLDGMLFGLGTDIALIVLGVILLTRSGSTGLVVLLVGLFPTVVVFGAMGWTGSLVDIGSVMTPCVAVGVTVDDVIHLLLCHRRGARGGLAAPSAALLAYDTCGRAIVQSWGIIGIGLSAFALSSFVPTFRFGLLMFLLLTAGLLANLLFLPALLSGVLGGRIVATQQDRLATPPVNP